MLMKVSGSQSSDASAQYVTVYTIINIIQHLHVSFSESVGEGRVLGRARRYGRYVKSV